MKGIMSVIEVMVTGIILMAAFIHFFPQYSIKTEWDRVLLGTEVMDTMNTIENLKKTYVFATCSTAFDDFMGNLYTAETTGAMIWWKETDDLQGYTEDMRIPYFTQAYKESMVDVTLNPTFQDNFNDISAWTDVTGGWSIESSELNASGSDIHISLTGFVLDNGVIESKVRIIDDGGDPMNWIGIVFRKNNQLDTIWNSGYMVYLRNNGDLDLYTAADGVIATASTGITPSSFVIFKVEFFGNKIKVYIDDTKYIDTTHSRYSSGFMGLHSYVEHARFDDFVVRSDYDVYSFTLGLGYPY